MRSLATVRSATIAATASGSEGVSPFSSLRATLTCGVELCPNLGR
jgi:hypothetical protein